MSPSPERTRGRLFDSIRWNFLLMGGVGIGGLILLGVLGGSLAFSTLMEAERLHLQETANMAANSMELILAGTSVRHVDSFRIQQIVKTLKKDARFRFTLILENGVVLADSDADPRYMENHAQRPEIALALLGQSDFEIRFSHTLGMQTLYFARPWEGIVLRAAMPVHFILPLQTSIFAAGLTVCAVSIATMFLVSWRMYRRIKIPINQILETARAWEEGREPPPLYLQRPSELVGIARALRSMAEELRGKIEDTELREQELHYLFGAIREAVLVLDQNQIIYRYNDSARDFIATLESGRLNGPAYWPKDEDPDRLIGMHLLTFIRSSELAEAVSDCDRTGKAISTRISLYGSSLGQFSIYVAPLVLPVQSAQRLFILVLYLS